jgi:hypothetical protein
MERNYWPLLSKMMIVAKGRMRCGHASRSRMLEGNACIVGVDVAVWRLTARRCRDELPNDSSRSCNRGVIRCSG